MGKITISKIKELFSDDKQIKRFFKRANEIGVNSVMNAGKTIQSGTVNTIKATSPFFKNLPKIIIGIIIFFTIYFTGTRILNNIYNLIETFFKFFINYIGSFGVRWVTIFVFGFLFLFVITSLVPKKQGSEILQKEFTIFLWILGIILIFGIISNTSFIQNYSGQEQLNIVTDNVVKTQTSFIDKIKCSFDPSCIANDLNKKEVQVAPDSKFSIYLQRDLIQGFSLTKTDLKNPLEINYKFTSTSEIKINKIECYIGSRIGEPFYSSSLNIPIKTDSTTEILETFKCENILDAVSKEQTKKKQEHTIITVLSMSLDDSLLQTIPIIDYKLAKEKLGLNINQDYSKINLIQRLKKENLISNDDSKLVDSSGFFNINSYDKSIFPLIFNDGKKDIFSVPIIFSKKDFSNLGKFKSGKITNIELPVSIGFQDGNFISNTTKIQFSENKFKINLKLIEEENLNKDNSQFLTKQNLNINMKINFEKEDRFRIKIVDWNISSNSNYSKLN